MRRKLVKIAAIIFALALIFASFFAIQLGIDNDPGWGRGRILMLVLGVAVLAWAGWDRVRPQVSASVKRVLAPLRHTVPARLLRSARRRWTRFLRTAFVLSLYKKARRFALPAVVLAALLVYNWVFTAGTMTDWPAGSRYFHMLAEGFAAGQLHLQEEPSPQLLASENPYFYKDRGEIPVLWDSLFYQGKYYLYWGPVPGLIVLLLQPFSPERIRDTFLIAVFMLGFLCTGTLLFRAIWDRFSWLPRKMLPGGLLAFLLSAPMLWLFTRPRVYEAAIAGGQFFFIGGLYFAFTALRHEKISSGRLFSAGLFWALAVNTRVNLAFVVTFAGLLVFWLLFQRTAWQWRPALRLSFIFGLPLLLGALGLMGYNYARFGSPFDFGYNFLITGPTIPEDPSRKSSTDYIIPNLYQYLIRPPEVQAEFPYLIVPWIKNDMWPSLIRLPRDYFYTEPVASLLLTVPAAGLGALVAARWAWLSLNGLAPLSPLPLADRRLYRWLLFVLSGNIFFAFIVLLLFTQNTYRYLVDFTPAAVLLSILLTAGYRARTTGIENWLWRTGWRLAVFLTPLFGILIAITGYARAFEKTNPDLYGRLLDIFP